MKHKDYLDLVTKYDPEKVKSPFLRTEFEKFVARQMGWRVVEDSWKSKLMLGGTALSLFACAATLLIALAASLNWVALNDKAFAPLWYLFFGSSAVSVTGVTVLRREKGPIALPASGE